MPCTSREETPETFGSLLFWELHWMRKISEEGGTGSQMCLPGSAEGMKSPRGVWAGEAGPPLCRPIHRTCWANPQALCWGVPCSCSESLLPTYPWCLLRDDKSIRPQEQSFTGRSSGTPREHHQSCASSELRAAEWTRPLLYPAPSV